MLAIEVSDLTKSYGRREPRTALRDLSLEVPEGSIFGFLGPNGSGKTTTIRCLLGLVKPDQGSMKLLGVDSAQRHEVLPLIGSIVDTPTFFPRFSAMDNLLDLAGLVGRGRAEVQGVLNRVGLQGRERDAVANYSLGMKQRLGLAAALLKEPKLLILDEPAHGLDPEGITDIRLLLKEIASEGRTVFLSSHLLSEVQALCDYVAILKDGQSLVQGKLKDLLKSWRPNEVAIKCSKIDEAAHILRTSGFEVRKAEDGLRVAAEAGQLSEINKLLSQNGIFSNELRPVELTLEEVYLELGSK